MKREWYEILAYDDRGVPFRVARCKSFKKAKETQLKEQEQLKKPCFIERFFKVLNRKKFIMMVEDLTFRGK